MIHLHEELIELISLYLAWHWLIDYRLFSELMNDFISAHLKRNHADS